MTPRLATVFLVAGLAAALTAEEAAAQAAGEPPDCGSELALCLNDGRFLVEATWRTREGNSGSAQAVGLTDETGYFWFFEPNNIEVVAKALNGCSTDGHYWFFAAGLTNLEVTITVTNRATGEARVYSNPQGTPFEPIMDTAAFEGCESVPLLVTVSRYQFSPGGPDGPPIRLTAGVRYRITFRSSDVIHGISAIPRLGIDSREVGPGSDYVVTVTPTAAQRGRYNFACTRVCGVGHGGMFGAIEVE